MIRTAITLIAFLATPLALACDYPARPHIPDGATATKDELNAARVAVGSFFDGVDVYLQCIETEARESIEAMDNADAEEVARIDSDLNKAFDAGNSEKAVVGELLNKQIRTYNAQRQQKKAEAEESGNSEE